MVCSAVLNSRCLVGTGVDVVRVVIARPVRRVVVKCMIAFGNEFWKKEIWLEVRKKREGGKKREEVLAMGIFFSGWIGK